MKQATNESSHSLFGFMSPSMKFFSPALFFERLLSSMIVLTRSSGAIVLSRIE